MRNLKLSTDTVKTIQSEPGIKQKTIQWAIFHWFQFIPIVLNILCTSMKWSYLNMEMERLGPMEIITLYKSEKLHVCVKKKIQN